MLQNSIFPVFIADGSELSQLLREGLTQIDLGNRKASDSQIIAAAEMMREEKMIARRLKMLELGNNSDISDESMQELGEICSRSKNLRFLSISKCSVGSNGLKILLSGLQNAPNLRSLDLSGICKNEDFAEGCRAIAQFLGVHKNILFLNLSECQIQSSGMELICDALIKQNSLKSLILGSCGITEDSLAKLVDALRINRSVIELCLNQNFISDKGVEYLCKYLSSKDSHVEVLSISVCGITEVGARSISDMLKINQSLKRIYCRKNKFGLESAKLIANGIAENCKLESVDFSDCQMEVEGISEYIFQGIAKNNFLTELNFVCSDLRLDNAKVLAECLRNAKNLITLNISRNPRMTQEGLKEICFALEDNSSIIRLCMANTALTYQSFQILSKFISKTPNLMHLEISSNDISDEAAGYLSKAFEENPEKALEYLDIGCCGIGAEGLKLLCKSLCQYPKLGSIGLGKNVFEDQGAQTLCEFLENCWSLSVLQVNSCRLTDIGFQQISKFLISHGKKSNLTVLLLQGNNASESGVRGLLKAFRETNIIYLGLNTYVPEWSTALNCMRKNHKSLILESRKSFFSALLKRIPHEKFNRLEFSCIHSIFEYSGLDAFEKFPPPTTISDEQQQEISSSSIFEFPQTCTIS